MRPQLLPPPYQHQPTATDLDELRTIMKGMQRRFNKLFEKKEIVFDQYYSDIETLVGRVENFKERLFSMPYPVSNAGANDQIMGELCHLEINLRALIVSLPAAGNNHGVWQNWEAYSRQMMSQLTASEQQNALLNESIRQLQKLLDKSEATCAELKAEVESLKKENKRLATPSFFNASNAALKAEVELLREKNRELTMALVEKADWTWSPAP